MKRLLSVLVFFAVSVCAGRAQPPPVTEMIRGTLGRNPGGDVVVQLELPSDRLGLFADKAGQDAEFTLAALHDLIVERFRYLLRLRAGGGEFAPTSVVLSLPTTGAALPATLRLTATWARRPGLEQAQAVTNTDSLTHRFVLELATVSGPAKPTGAAARFVAAESESWWTTLTGAGALGIAQVVPGGLDVLLFALGCYFSGRRWRDLAWRMGVLVAAHSVGFWLTLAGIFPAGGLWSGWVAVGVALSIVAVALLGCREGSAPDGVGLALIAGCGLLHGQALSRGLAEASWPPGRWIPATLAAHAGIAVGLGLVLVVAAVFTAAWWDRPWYRRRIAVPANVAIGLGGLVWTVARFRTL